MGLSDAMGSLLGGIGGGIFSAFGQSKANKANLQIARENREWQEKMSNTAYQRAAKDLDAAGLNRILALGSPSSTPGGNVATMGNVGKAATEGFSQTASGIATAMQTSKIGAEKEYIEAQTAESGARKGQIDQQTKLIGAQLGLTEKQTSLAAAQIDLAKGNEQLARMQAKKVIEEARNISTAADKAKFELGLMQSLYEGKVGQALYYIKEMAAPLAALGIGAGLGKGLRRKDKPSPEYKKFKPGRQWTLPETNF